MGYYTTFEGGVSGPPEFMQEFIDAVECGETYGQYGAELADWTIGEFFGGDSAKWYDWSKDMKTLSAKYPALLFWISGEGEEAGDIWKAWARNGKLIEARAKIVFDEPNLDVELPTPDLAAKLEEIRAVQRKQIDDEIADLKKKRAALDGLNQT